MCIYKKGLLDINQEIIVETIHCVEDFECLANEKFVCREATVESSIEGKIIFISCRKELCAYKLNFGYGTICNCPTRREIYNKYKI